MDIRTLLSAVTQCLQAGSTTRKSLGHWLEQLLDATKHLKAINVEAASLLSHMTLAATRLLTPGAHLSDRERELTLECLLEALTLDSRKPFKHMTQVHAIIIDHLGRILVQLITLDGSVGTNRSPFPEPTRLLAVKCWRQLVVGISTVHVPQTHPHPRNSQNPGGGTMDSVPRTMVLRDYVQEYLPVDYLPLAVCGLLDNAEIADDQQLRALALDTLAASMGKSGVLGDPKLLAPVFPGVASALARVALAQAPKELLAASKNDFQGELDKGMANMRVAGSTSAASGHRKPTAPVRASALNAMRRAVLVMYANQENTKATADTGSELVENWAHRAKAGIESIIHQGAQDGSNKEEEEEEEGHIKSKDGPVEPEKRMLQILWRIAGLRHTEYSQISNALLALFSDISLGCAALQDTLCLAVSIETSLILSMRHASELASADYLRRLTDRCTEGAVGIIRGRLVDMLESALPLFEKYIGNGTEQQRLDILCLVSGYLRVLGRTEARSLLAPWWGARGLRALLSALTVSLPGTSLLITEVAEGASEKETSGVSYILDHFRSTELSDALNEFIERIAAVFTPVGLCSQLLELLISGTSRATAHASAALWVLARVAPTADNSSGGNSELASISQPIFQYTMEYFSAPRVDDNDDGLDSNFKTGSAVAVVDSTERTLHSCMVLHAISVIVPSVGPAIAYYMDMLLFPMLQISMADSPLLQQQARRSLNIIAQTSGSSTVSQMLSDNVDYIVEGCSQQIRSVDLHPHVFSILTSAVQLVGAGILVYMDDVVEDTLDVCENLAMAVEDGKEDVSVSALRFLEIVTRTIADANASGMLEHQCAEAGEGMVGAADADPVGTVIAELDELAAQEQMSELFDLDDAGDDIGIGSDQPLATRSAQDPADSSLEQAGSPLAIKIALVVQNLLSSDSSAQQLLALKIVQNTVRALANTKDLLPLVNHVWPPLVHRLAKDHDQFYVTLAACDVIEAACALGESWMRRRVKDDLWLHFRRILGELGGAQRSSERALVSRVLRTMGTVVDKVPLEEPVAWELCCLTMRFLGHSALHDDALLLLKRMVPLYGDKIWLVLAKLGKAGINPADIPALPGIPKELAVPADICQVLGLLTS
ncbi:hypothetical protein LPJ66_005415 [Kickxella alabastrina]|uniref:Uncharacterized protein n=1 Tax=Kickxella alabastrina TaxID=61397 RepID=A0ACC1IF64_9FUNG|nr:hypothetical protein LPJ66_005415 [Kickxella alabastrina]